MWKASAKSSSVCVDELTVAVITSDTRPRLDESRLNERIAFEATCIDFERSEPVAIAMSIAGLMEFLISERLNPARANSTMPDAICDVV